MSLLALVVLLALNTVECIKTTYFIGIREEDWDYAPSGKNIISGQNIADDEHSSVFLTSGPHHIGRVYRKAIYRQYTDSTYSTEIPKPAWLGFLGPVLRAEVGDVIVVHLKNFASRPYSLHPHGVFYEKDSEGAWYPDETSGKLKEDDYVQPGQTYTYTWRVTPEYAPAEGDTNCLTWPYHSHVDSPKDIASGLIGALLTCKKGVLKDDVSRSDVDQDFVLMFSVVDENLSWYLDENIKRFCTDPDGVNMEDEEFQESNLMHSINGYVYGNLPGLEVCKGSMVSWHLFGIGNEGDIHSAYFHGHTLLDRGHRTDVLSLFPGTSVTAEMIPRTIGKWLLSCQVNAHIQAGMQAFYQVSACDSKFKAAPTAPPGHERHYYIAAEEIMWDYAPLDMNTFTGQPLTTPDSDSEVFFSREDGRLGGIYQKVHYVRYTDSTFTTAESQEEHLGILGPVIRAETGDVVVVTFLNKAKYNYSIQPHGLHYEKAYEGAKYQDGSQKDGASVPPGERFIYRWKVTEGPSDSDPPCLSYLYYSASDPVPDTNSGLVGPLLVCKRGALDDSMKQKEVDRELFLLFSVIDENESWYLDDNIQKFGSDKSDKDSQDFQESNKMHAVNGYMYGNLPGLDSCEGDHVVWHTLGLGTEEDIHGVHFQGNTFKRDNTNQDTLSLFPHTSVTVTMTPDNDGPFEVSSLTSDHYRAGMRQHYTVKHCKGSQRSTATPSQPPVRYFLAAVEVEWDYAPSRTWEVEKYNNTTLNNSYGDVFLAKSEDRIGSKYKKVVFREYTDDTFKTQKKHEEHLGILGPILRAEVGERIQVVFRNKATKPFSLYAHGVKTRGGHRSPAQPGSVRVYEWDVPERSGPGPSDPVCITYAYYSTADFVKDLMSGLVGPLVVCRKGTLNEQRQRTDVQREFALLFMVFDENESWYLDDNIKTYLKKDPKRFDTGDPKFMESNMMHGINGKLYANLQGLVMNEGEKINWYLMGLGNEIHTVNFHGQSFIYKTDQSHRADVFSLVPGTFQTIEMTAGNPGTWLLQCYVFDHIHSGMETTFKIVPVGGSKDQSSGQMHNGSSHMRGHSPLTLGLLALVLLALGPK